MIDDVTVCMSWIDSRRQEMEAYANRGLYPSPPDSDSRIARSILQHLSRIAELEAKLAAAEEMRDALEQLAKLGNGDQYGNSRGNIIAQQALKAYEEAGR